MGGFWIPCFSVTFPRVPDSSVGIGTDYGVDGPGIESSPTSPEQKLESLTSELVFEPDTLMICIIMDTIQDQDWSGYYVVLQSI
jgi:hypothetical protein